MPFSYNGELATDLDWVRFLTGDKTLSEPLLSDEEIIAILAEESKLVSSAPDAIKYFAAASALEGIGANWVTISKGLSEKRIKDLTLVWSHGTGTGVLAALINLAADLRRRGDLRLKSRKPFTSMGNRRRRGIGRVLRG
jgi:hypothetical protein